MATADQPWVTLRRTFYTKESWCQVHGDRSLLCQQVSRSMRQLVGASLHHGQRFRHPRPMARPAPGLGCLHTRCGPGREPSPVGLTWPVGLDTPLHAELAGW